jgi:hypothetical protein
MVKTNSTRAFHSSHQTLGRPWRPVIPVGLPGRALAVAVILSATLAPIRLGAEALPSPGPLGVDGGKGPHGTLDSRRGSRVPPGLVGVVSERARGHARSQHVEIFACTGFVVGTPRGQEVATARHCLKSRAGMRIFDGMNTAHAQGPRIPNHGADVMLVGLAGQRRFPEALLGDSRRLRHGERLCAWRVREEGNAPAWEQACGRFLGRSIIDAGRGAHPVLLMEHVLKPGFSGGPVVDAAGHVIGVAVAAADDMEYDAVEPIEAVTTLADRGPSPKSPPRASEPPAPDLPPSAWTPAQAAGAAPNPAGTPSKSGASGGIP